MLTSGRRQVQEHYATLAAEHGSASSRPTGDANDRSQVRAGVGANQVCACCGCAMDCNQASWDHVRASDYCCECGRDPLCRSCAHFVRPAEIDIRWTFLTAVADREAAAGRVRRTVAGVERAWDIVCCFCLGQLGEEHDEPEQPLAIHPARPEGWTMCDECVVTYETLRDGSRQWVHRCPHCDTWRTRSCNWPIVAWRLPRAVLTIKTCFSHGGQGRGGAQQRVAQKCRSGLDANRLASLLRALQPQARKGKNPNKEVKGLCDGRAGEYTPLSGNSPLYAANEGHALAEDGMSPSKSAGRALKEEPSRCQCKCGCRTKMRFFVAWAQFALFRRRGCFGPAFEAAGVGVEA